MKAPPRPGDECGVNGCNGRIVIYMTRLNFVRRVRIRYLRCPACGDLPAANKWIVPLEYAPAKKRNDNHA